METILGGNGLVPASAWSAVSFGIGLIACALSPAGKLYALISLCLVMLLAQMPLKRRLVLLVGGFLLGFGWGWLDHVRHPSFIDRVLSVYPTAKEAAVTGIVASEPVVDGDRLRFILSVRELELDGNKYRGKERVWVRVRLRSRAEKERAEAVIRGMTVQLPLIFERPDPPRNPGAFHFPRYLWMKHAAWAAEAEGLSRMIILRDSPWYGWRLPVQIRRFLEARLDMLYSGETAGFMKGMLLGSRDQVPAELEESYRRAGILHLLAISGFHVMVVVAGLIYLLKALGLTRERSYETALIFLPFYLLLTGLSASAVRAGLMGMIYLAARRMNQGYSAWKAITAAFLLMAVWNPRQLFDTGFQLSYAVTFGLIAFTGPFAEKLRRICPPLPEGAATSLSVAVVAQLFSFPFVAGIFHQFSAPSLPINLILVPLFALILPWGYANLLLSLPFPAMGKWIAFPLDGFLQLLHRLLSPVSSAPHMVISVPDLPFWWYASYALAVLLLLQPAPDRHGIGENRPVSAKARAAGMLLLLLFLVTPFLFAHYSKTVRITFLDVGQGDSILVQGPGGKNILIDGGGEGYIPKEEWQRPRDPFETGKDVVVAALRALGVTRIDWLVMSHGDGDHIGGLREVVKQFPVGRVLVNGLPPSTPLEKELLGLIRERGIPLFSARPGPWLEGNEGVLWTILAGGDALMGTDAGDNNASVVLLLSAYGIDFLFTGDLEAEGERELVRHNPGLDIEVLKVGHHGSKSSTTAELLDAVKPEIAVISVGRGNRYGHPAKEVLDRLAERNVRVYRTDRQGALTFTVHPDGLVTWKSWIQGNKTIP